MSFSNAVSKLSDDELNGLLEECTSARGGNDAAKLAFTVAGGIGAVTAAWDFGATGAGSAAAMGASGVADFVIRKIEEAVRNEQNKRQR